MSCRLVLKCRRICNSVGKLVWSSQCAVCLFVCLFVCVQGGSSTGISFVHRSVQTSNGVDSCTQSRVASQLSQCRVQQRCIWFSAIHRVEVRYVLDTLCEGVTCPWQTVLRWDMSFTHCVVVRHVLYIHSRSVLWYRYMTDCSSSTYVVILVDDILCVRLTGCVGSSLLAFIHVLSCHHYYRHQ